MQNILPINYKELRKISLKTARQSVIKYLIFFKLYDFNIIFENMHQF